MDTLEQRLDCIVRTSYRLLCKKIVGGVVSVDNEASLQLQFGVILKTIGQLYEFSRADHFSIVLERVVEDKRIQTWKSHGRARIDVCIMLTDGTKTKTAAIELKFFPKSEGETITDNRFAMLMDIENLETYKKVNVANLGYFLLYTTNKNYLTDSRSSVKIGNGSPIEKETNSNKRTVTIEGSYTLDWDTYSNDNYFLLLQT